MIVNDTILAEANPQSISVAKTNMSVTGSRVTFYFPTGVSVDNILAFMWYPRWAISSEFLKNISSIEGMAHSGVMWKYSARSWGHWVVELNTQTDGIVGLFPKDINRHSGTSPYSVDSITDSTIIFNIYIILTLEQTNVSHCIWHNLLRHDLRHDLVNVQQQPFLN